MITVNGPGGAVVNFPDGTDAAIIDKVMTENFSKPQAENSLAGSAKALASGIGEGVAGIAGLPADAVNLASKGIDYLAGTHTQDTVKPYADMLGAENIKSKIEGVTGEFYKPQTNTEKYLSTIGSFAPAALAGPGGIARRVATQVVAPGVASEFAGQMTEGTAAEPVARIAGALGGAALGSKTARALFDRPQIAAAPAAADISAAKTAAYSAPEVKALKIDTGAVEKIANRITQNLKADYYDAPKTYNILEMMKVPANPGSHSVLDLDNARKRLRDIAQAAARSGDNTEKAASTIAVKYLDGIIPNLGKLRGAVVAGDPVAASSALRAGRANAAASFRSEMVQEAIEKARNTAAATHSGGNFENEIYKQIRTWLNKPKVYLAGWNAAEKEALRAVLPGTGRGILRRAGKVLGGGGGLGQLASGSAGGAMFGVPGMIALPAMGLAANKAGSAITMSKMRNLDELLRARAPIYGAGNYANRIAALNGGSILSGLPSQQQLALQTALALRNQQQQYAGR